MEVIRRFPYIVRPYSFQIICLVPTSMAHSSDMAALAGFACEALAYGTSFPVSDDAR